MPSTFLLWWQSVQGAKGPWGTPQLTLPSSHLWSLSFLLCKMGPLYGVQTPQGKPGVGTRAVPVGGS